MPQYRSLTTTLTGGIRTHLLSRNYFLQKTKKEKQGQKLLPILLTSQFVENKNQLEALGHHSNTINPRDYWLFQGRLQFL